jgi:hypothetical protein
MKYWYDTEFIENGKTIDLLSIAVVAEDGREFYMENGSADIDKANDWVKANVIPYLSACLTNGSECLNNCPVRKPAQIRGALTEFCNPTLYGKPEFWGYYSAYDHVALCQLFGTMMDIPSGWPMYTRDIKQWCDQLGNPQLPEQDKNEHHALADARWNRKAWEFLDSIGRPVPVTATVGA